MLKNYLRYRLRRFLRLPTDLSWPQSQIIDKPRPDKIAIFEKLFDPQCGSYYMPQWLPPDAKFDDAMVAEWHVHFKDKLSHDPIELEVGHLYYWVTRLIRPRAILETGTNNGYSTALLAKALHDNGLGGYVITIDPNTPHHLYRDTIYERYIEFKQGFSQEVPIDDHQKFDMAVLDSDHTYDTIIAEIFRFEPMVRINGYIIMHDSVLFDGVGMAVKQLKETGRFESVTLPTTRKLPGVERSPGITMLRKLIDTPASPDIQFDECTRGVNFSVNGRNLQDRTWFIDERANREAPVETPVPD